MKRTLAFFLMFSLLIGQIQPVVAISAIAEELPVSIESQVTAESAQETSIPSDDAIIEDLPEIPVHRKSDVLTVDAAASTDLPEISFSQQSYNCSSDESVQIMLSYSYHKKWDGLTFTGNGALISEGFTVTDPGEGENTWIITADAYLTGEDDGVVTASFLVDGQHIEVSAQIQNVLVVPIVDPDVVFPQAQYSCPVGETITISAHYTYTEKWDQATWISSNTSAVQIGEMITVEPGEYGTGKDNLWWASVPVTVSAPGTYTVSFCVEVNGDTYSADATILVEEDNAITFPEDEYNAYVDEVLGMTAVYCGAEGWDSITWSCSDPTAVVFSACSSVGPGLGGTGIDDQWWASVQVTPLIIGNYTITVTAVRNGVAHSVSTTLNVTSAPVLYFAEEDYSTEYIYNNKYVDVYYEGAQQWDSLSLKSHSKELVIGDYSVAKYNGYWRISAPITVGEIGDYTITATATVGNRTLTDTIVVSVWGHVYSGYIDFDSQWFYPDEDPRSHAFNRNYIYPETYWATIDGTAYPLDDTVTLDYQTTVEEEDRVTTYYYYTKEYTYEFSPSIANLSGKQLVYYTLENDRITKIVAPQDVVSPAMTMKIATDSLAYTDGAWNRDSFGAKVDFLWRYKTNSYLNYASVIENKLEAELREMKLSVDSEALNFGEEGFLFKKDISTVYEEDLSLVIGEKHLLDFTIYTSDDYAPKEVNEIATVSLEIKPTWAEEQIPVDVKQIRIGNLDYQEKKAEEKKETSGVSEEERQMQESFDTLKANSAITLDYNFRKYFDNETYSDIQDFLIWYTGQCLSVELLGETVFEEQTSAFRNEVDTRIREWLGLEKPYKMIKNETLGLDFSSLYGEVTVTADTVDGQKVEIDFDLSLSRYAKQGSSPFGAYGVIDYSISIPDGEMINAGKAQFAYADFTAFSEIMLDYVKQAYMQMWGKTADKAASLVVNKTADFLLDGKYSKRAYDISTNFLKRAMNKLTINCPVDVYVYDSDGELCGAIVNNEVDPAYSDLYLTVDEDTKIVYLAGDDYNVRLVGNGPGTMSYCLEQYNGSEVIRTASIKDILLCSGKSYEATVPAGAYCDPLMLTLEGDMDERLYIQQDSMGKFDTDVDTDQPVAVRNRGTCGENVQWVQYTNDLLELSGSGSTDDYKGGYNETYPSYRYKQIKHAVILDDVTRLGNYSFKDMHWLRSVVLADSVTELGEYTFYSCGDLTTVMIGSGLTDIGDWSFSYCGNLNYFHVSEENEHFCSVDGALFTKDMTELVCFPRTSGDSYTVPDGVTTIGPDALGDNKYLKTVTLPSSVTTLGESAFDSSSAMEVLYINGNIETVGNYALNNCNSLKTIVLGPGSFLCKSGTAQECTQSASHPG